MSKEIINRVENSKLISIDLGDYYLPGKRYELDIKDWLVDGLYLKEKEFRKAVKNHNWLQYKDAFVAINCTSQAIIPPWAYMLISTQLSNNTKKTVIGNLNDLEKKFLKNKFKKLTSLFTKISQLLLKDAQIIKCLCQHIIICVLSSFL